MNSNFLTIILFGGAFFCCNVVAETFFDGCEPFTEEACRKAGENLGLVYGDNFLKGPAKTKGCYAYTSANPANAGQVFYGADGSESEMSLPVDRKSGQFRPLGHDCKKPNIIFLMADDMGYNDIGYNNKHVKTPIMDRLAMDGITLEQNYVQTMCTPSRISFLSGMYPYHVGRQENVLMWGTPTGLSLSRSTIADSMKTLGYDTHLVGKWHVGDCNEAYSPLNRGFDTFYGIHGAMGDYVYKTALGTILDWWDTEDGELVQIRNDTNPEAFLQHSNYQYEDRINALLSKYQNGESSNPFFMFLAMQLPHTPFNDHNLEDKYRDLYNSSAFQDERYENLATYDKDSADGMENHLGVIGLVSMLDDLVDKVITSLKDKGLYENTIFVFSSDNGGMSSAQVGNYPYKGFKTAPTEGGTKVPAFVHSPLLPTSQDFSGLTHITDWYPTFMRLGGETKTLVDGLNFDGVDQLEALFSGQGKKARTNMVYNFRNQIYWNDFKYGKALSGWIRDGDFKYGRVWIYDSAVFHILYDLKSDPTENDNVAFKYPDQLKTMQGMFDDLASSMVEADEPTATPTIFPPTDFLEFDVNGKAYLTSGWCGNDGQQPLYYDPCTSGPCK